MHTACGAGALSPTISGDGRLTTFHTSFDAATAHRTQDVLGQPGYAKKGPSTDSVYLYDRTLGITTLVTNPSNSQVCARPECCVGCMHRGQSSAHSFG